MTVKYESDSKVLAEIRDLLKEILAVMQANVKYKPR